MHISELSIRRPVLATVLTIIILLFGMIGYGSLGVRQYPRVDHPHIPFSSSYPGAPPAVTEKSPPPAISPASSRFSPSPRSANVNSVRSLHEPDEGSALPVRRYAELPRFV